jgi:hypothetical protein
MPRSIFYPETRRIVFHSFDPDENVQDLYAFLERVHESLNESLDATIGKDSLELRLEQAPRSWHLLNALKTGEIRPSFDGDYIRFVEPAPTN